MFSSMTFSVWPLTVGIGQLFILVIGVGASFAIANYFIKQGQNKVVAIAFAMPPTLIAAAIAFFEVSEMWLLEFMAKMIRTHFFDATVKFQVNVEKPDKINLLLKELHTEEQTQKIQFKTRKDLIADDTEKKLRATWLL